MCVRVVVEGNSFVSRQVCIVCGGARGGGADLDFAVRPKVDAVGQIAEGVRVVADEGARKVDVLQAKALVREGKQERMSS